MSKVRIIEVGPRDGLQNEKRPVDTDTKLALIDRLGEAGLTEIETTAFVSPKRVPLMADHDDVMKRLKWRDGVRYPVLVPNIRGYKAAIAAGAKQIALFASATEAFSQANIECSIDESFVRFAPVFEAARADGVAVRGYVSCVVACPYEGPTPPDKATAVAKRLLDEGCYEISLGDTIGAGTPTTVKRLLDSMTKAIPVDKLAGHFHDTYGMAAANAYASYEYGLRAFDSSVAGLGGCPYAKGATGNVATEDLVYLFQDMGVDTGIDMNRLLDCVEWISTQLGRGVQSRVGSALLAKRKNA